MVNSHMNPLLLRLSLAANCVLIGIAGYFLLPRVQEIAPSVPTGQKPLAASASVRMPAGIPRGWGQIDSGDYFTLVVNLRRIGCPETSLFDIVFGKVSRDYSSKAKDVQREAWSSGASVSTVKEELARLRGMELDLIASLLGPDARARAEGPLAAGMEPGVGREIPPWPPRARPWLRRPVRHHRSLAFT